MPLSSALFRPAAWLSRVPGERWTPLCLHLLIGRWFGRFGFVVVVNHAVLKTGVRMSFRIVIFLWIEAQKWDYWIVRLLHG